MSEYVTQRMPGGELPTCALVQDLLPLYLESEVTPDAYGVIVDHLAHCERCSGFLKGAQSARTQMLREQQAIKAAHASGRSVSAVPQPLHNAASQSVSFTLMSGSWAFGLFGTALGLLGAHPTVILIGLALTIFGIAGLLTVRQTRSGIWRTLSLLTGVLGFWCWVLETMPFLTYGDPFQLMGMLPPLVGTLLLAIGGWGVWLSRQPTPPGIHQASSDLRLGPDAAVTTALGGILAGAALMFLALIGAWLIVAHPYWLPYQLIGVVLGTTSVLGLLQLNHRRGWLAELAVPQTKRRLMALVILGSGLVWSLLATRGWGIVSTRLLVLAVGAGLVTVGAWWFQRKV